MAKVTKYATVVNPQINPNLAKRNGWWYMGNAVGHTNNYAVSSYTKKTTTTGKGKNKKTTTTYNYPYKVNANVYKFNIPSDAYIKEVKFEVCMKTDTTGTGSTFPELGFFIKDRNLYHGSDGRKGKTGWYNGTYWVYSNKKLSKSWSVATYVMNESTYNKGGFTVANLNSDYFGVDMSFADNCNPQDVYLRWVRCTITYDTPTYSLTHDYASNSESNPASMITGVSKFVTFTLKQSTKCKGGTHVLDVNIPYGTDLENYYCTNGSYNSSNNQWTVNCDGVTTATLRLEIMDYTVNTQNIIVIPHNAVLGLGSPINSKTFWYQTNRGWVDDYTDNLKIEYASTTSPHKRHTSCFKISSTGVSDNDELTYLINNTGDCDLISLELEETTSSSVSIKSSNLDYFIPNPDGSKQIPSGVNIELVLNVPDDNERFDVVLDLCLRPKTQGDNQLNVDYGGVKFADYTYNVAQPFYYHIGSTLNDSDTIQHEGLSGERVKFTNHRVASNLETGAFVLPCRVKEGDSIMTEGGTDIHMYKWEEIDYIGCVPVEHHHFDPKSTYKDTLIDTHYKNNRFMGKQLAPDEDITLNIRLHPHQVTTIQGLIDMDKPIPINANHKCFESDALNHRGWAEIYGIKTEETNPHWYKCDIDVKYITHNLNTRFHITQGDRTFNYTIPSLLAEIKASGDAISEYQSQDFFMVDTDGTYAYIEDEGKWETYYDYNGNSITWLGDSESINYTIYVVDDEELQTSKAVTKNGTQILAYLEELGETIDTPVLNEPLQSYETYTYESQLKNRFSLDEGQHISIKSRNPLSTINEISFNWLSSRLTEVKENNISRVFRLIDAKTKDVVFEYEYCDFDFSSYTSYENVIDDYTDGILFCRAIGRVKNQGDYETVIDEQVRLIVDAESGESYQDEDSDSILSTLQYFGSNLHFRLNNTVLGVIDEGYNGKEVSRDGIQLEGNQYYYEAYWVNKNTDGEDADIISYFDIVVQDSILETTFADKYSSMYISPFPVSDKKILFTRKAEEGIIYYLEDNNEEFTYLIDPYYQYHCGVDLRSESGTDSSIFNLNYGYKTVYLENGLVSVGINRLNGKMYLKKYDPELKEYITLFNLHLNKYDDININSISDDRIELQASDSTIIMYRGHPYVIFKHELEDIGLDTKFIKVWGQSVDGNTNDYPVYFDLMNHENLLPVCVTSKLNDDCVSLSEHEITGLTDITVTVSADTTSIFEGESVNLRATGQPNGSKVSFLIKKDDEDGFDEVGSTTSGLFNYQFDSTGAYQVIAVYVGDDTYSYSVSEPISIDVGAKLTQSEIEELIEDDEEYERYIDEVAGNYSLSMECPSTMTYLGGEKIVFTLTKGGVPVNGKVVQMVDFNNIGHNVNTATTGENAPDGQVIFYNTRSNTHPAKYKIGARYYEGSRVVTKVFKDVTVKKATPSFSLNHRAVNTNKYFSVNLHHGNHKLSGKKVNITVNSNKNERKTNTNGNASVKITSKGVKKYTCVFNGDKDYKKCKFTYREKVVNG